MEKLSLPDPSRYEFIIFIKTTKGKANMSKYHKNVEYFNYPEDF